MLITRTTAQRDGTTKEKRTTNRTGETSGREPRHTGLVMSRAILIKLIVCDLRYYLLGLMYVKNLAAR